MPSRVCSGWARTALRGSSSCGAAPVMACLCWGGRPLPLRAQSGCLSPPLAAAGGGGMIAGIAAIVKALKPGIKIIGVEPTGANAMVQVRWGCRRCVAAAWWAASGGGCRWLQVAPPQGACLGGWPCVRCLPAPHDCLRCPPFHCTSLPSCSRWCGGSV